MKITLQTIESSYKTKDDVEILNLIMSIIDPKGLFMEFGVSQIHSVLQKTTAMGKYNIIHTIYGFDFNVDLPESSEDLPVGSLKSLSSADRPRFCKTLQQFLLEHPEYISFVHFVNLNDYNVYSSVKNTLNELNSQIQSDTILLFDEMINVNETHELQAFNEFLEENNKEADLICHGECQVAFKIR